MIEMFVFIFLIIILINAFTTHSQRDSKFIAMLKTAKHVPSTYIPPSRKDVGGCLLVENYKDYLIETTKKLLIDVGFFGLTAMGDGATIVKCPRTNILFAGKCCHYLNYVVMIIPY